VRFELTARTRVSTRAWIVAARLRTGDYLAPRRMRTSPHLSTGQYARIVTGWVSSIALGPGSYGAHTLRRTKAMLIDRSTKNLRAVQLLLGHSELDSTIRFSVSKSTMH
jgi:integrase